MWSCYDKMDDWCKSTINVINLVYYQHAMNVITTMSHGFKRPNFYIRGYYLAKTSDEVKLYVESYQETWKKTGCTLMTNEWTNQKKKTLINLLVYCPKGIIFLKFVDASKVSKTAGLLYKLFRETVLYIRPKNIVHMVIENASN